MKVLWFGHPQNPVGGHLLPEQTPILLVSNVTAPVRAYSPQFDDASVVAVMEISARMLPLKLVPVPKVAELPTCQKTLADVAPLISNTCELLAVIRVLPVWKMKAPMPLRVSVPVKKAEESKQYTPGVRGEAAEILASQIGIACLGSSVRVCGMRISLRSRCDSVTSVYRPGHDSGAASAGGRKSST